MLGNAIRGLTDGFLKIFGDIKVFKWPFFLVYDPSGYKVRGEEVREVITQARPGDILVRGYNNYLDGFFIPGYFSHAGLYVGEVTEKDRQFLVAERGQEFFKTGDQMVVHAMAEGVFMEDLINFCRCDKMAIVRLPAEIKPLHKAEGQKMDTSNFTPEELQFHEALQKGQSLTSDQVFPTLFQLALSQVGKPYDFSFNFSNYNNLSCTEFVQFVIKSLESHHGLSPQKKKFLLFKKEVLTPDAYMTPSLDLAWQSRSNDPETIRGLRGES